MRRNGRLIAALAAHLLAASASRASDGQGMYVPGNLSAPVSPIHGDPGMGAITVIGTMLLAGAGGWLLLKGRKLPFPGRVAKKLSIDETRSLGSRQYLVVASYEGKKMLLVVCPGRIDLITPLNGQDTTAKAS
jgi:flagellar protein FliO/FliZ